MNDTYIYSTGNPGKKELNIPHAYRKRFDIADIAKWRITRDNILHSMKVLESNYKITRIKRVDEAIFRMIKDNGGVCGELLDKLQPDLDTVPLDPKVRDIMVPWAKMKQQIWETKCLDEIQQKKRRPLKKGKTFPMGTETRRSNDWKTSHIGNMLLRDVKPEHIYVEKLKMERAGQSPNTWNNYVSQLSGAWRHNLLVDGGGSPMNPVMQFTSAKTNNPLYKKKTKGRHYKKTWAFSDAVIKDLIQACYARDAEVRDYAYADRVFQHLGQLMELTTLTGIRRRFICNLNFEQHIRNWGANDGTTPYIEMWMKRDTIAEIPLTKRAVEIITELLPMARKWGGYLFVAPRENGPIQNFPTAIYDDQIVPAVMANHTVPNGYQVKPVHSIRDYVVSRLMENQVPAKMTATILGISERVVQDHYTNLRGAWREDGVKAMEAAFGE